MKVSESWKEALEFLNFLIIVFYEFTGIVLLHHKMYILSFIPDFAGEMQSGNKATRLVLRLHFG